MENKQTTNNVKDFSKGKSNGVETHVTNEHDVKIAQLKYEAQKHTTDKENELAIKRLELEKFIQEMDAEMQKIDEERKNNIEEMKLRDAKSLKKTQMITDTVGKVAGFGMLTTVFIMRSHNATKLNIAKVNNGITD